MTDTAGGIILETGEVVPVGSRSLGLPGKVARAYLELPEALSYEEWRGIGETLRGVEGSLMWWIGDWVRFGEKRWGERYQEAVAATGAAYGTVANAKSVAAKFDDFSRRRENLSWAHHVEVAALAPDVASTASQEE